MSLEVSAIIVTFNHAPFIEEAIRSALGQAGLAEIVVIDDGSSDDTVVRARRITDPRVRVIDGLHRGLQGLAMTYNDAYRASSGDLVAILEGDDRWPEGKLALQLPHFVKEDVVVSHGAYAVIGARGNVLRQRMSAPHDLPNGPYDALPLHLTSSYVMAVTAVIRRSALDRVGGFAQLAGTPHWDHPTFLRLSEIGRFTYTSSVVGIWRKHASSGTMRLAGHDVHGAFLAREEALRALSRQARRRDLPSRMMIERAWSDAAALNSFQLARVLSSQRRRTEARRAAITGYRQARSLRSKLRLLAAAALISAGIDLEIFTGLGERSTLEELS